MYRKVSATSLLNFLCPVSGFTKGGNLMSIKLIMTGIKLSALIKKQVESPNSSMIKPAKVGPMSFERLTIDELRASALGRSDGLLISSLTSDCRAGTSKLLMVPSTMLSKMMAQKIGRAHV